ncbi:MAG: ThiF family adenylyltransferase [Jiangellaceae bacterium]
MRPLVHPALTQVWRDDSTVQIGLDPARAVVVGGMGPVETTVLRAIDGVRDEAALRNAAQWAGGDAAVADRLISILGSAGVLVDGDRATAADPDDALTPDRAVLGLLTTDPDGGAMAMGSRQRATVVVRGCGRVGSVVAGLLGAAGVGQVLVDDDAPVTAADLAPGGHGPDDIGRPRARAVEARLAASTEDDQPQEPDLVVLAPSTGSARYDAAMLLRAGVTHLVALVVETTGIVGPLVLPGRSSCLRCHDLHRTARDPVWPRILAQADRSPPDVTACDVTLATQAAATAAQQVLAHLDGFVPATVDGTVEICLPYGLARRRRWHPHPACGCMWAA